MRPLTSANKKLSECAGFLGIELSNAELVTGICSNSRQVQPGDIFAALPGEKFHGASFASEAISKGAIAIFTDNDGAALLRKSATHVPLLVMENPRKLLGPFSSFLYGEPSKSMKVIGVTGTNGKTTTTHLLFQIFRGAGLHAGLIGTVGNQIDDEKFEAIHTTPEADELQRLLALMRDRGVEFVAMEVSSHALAQFRADGVTFETVGFTNLTQDHLDFHQTMANYFQAKSRLFAHEFSNQGSVVIDDSYGMKLKENATLKISSVSVSKNSADWFFQEASPTKSGYQVLISGPSGIKLNGALNLVGAHNLENVLLAISLAHQAGIEIKNIEAVLPKLTGAPGRLERIERGQDFIALVDYAHTPDAVNRILKSVRQLTNGKIIAVLGCGGDRDKSKRPLMGAALIEGADIPIFTSDNPRSESPMKIIEEMTSGLTMPADGRVIIDRRAAIKEAVQCALDGDLLIVLGKGHETGQEIDGKKYPFDDRLILGELLDS